MAQMCFFYINGEQEKESIIYIKVEKKLLQITVCHHSANLVMPNGDPRNRFFYPTLTLTIDSYILSFIVGQTNTTGPIDAGYFSQGGSTHPRPDNDQPGRTEGVCPKGSYCPEGSTNPTPCPAGTYGYVLYDFLVTVKVAPHVCIIRTGQP